MGKRLDNFARSKRWVTAIKVRKQRKVRQGQVLDGKARQDGQV